MEVSPNKLYIFCIRCISREHGHHSSVSGHHTPCWDRRIQGSDIYYRKCMSPEFNEISSFQPQFMNNKSLRCRSAPTPFCRVSWAESRPTLPAGASSLFAQGAVHMINLVYTPSISKRQGFCFLEVIWTDAERPMFTLFPSHLFSYVYRYPPQGAENDRPAATCASGKREGAHSGPRSKSWAELLHLSIIHPPELTFSEWEILG